jgi:hypothetical protein
MRVIRLVVYEGTEKWITETISHSIKGVKDCLPNGKITAITLGTVPDDLVIFLREEKEGEKKC